MPDKTIAQKLLIKPGQSILLVNAPENAAGLLGPLPDDVQLMTATPDGNPSVAGDAAVVLLFAGHRADLETLLPGLPAAALAAGAVLWVAYHKGTSAIKTDINRDSIWSFAKTVGMDGVAMISLNEDWSAMRLKQLSAGRP